MAASYYFYMCWKVEYVILLIVCTFVNYFAALQIARHDEKRKKKWFLYLSLFTSLGMLFAFKYFNFFNENVHLLFTHFNIFYKAPAFRVLLPIGISFYTFQTLSYTIDVYCGTVPPEKHPGIFALYVSFFPQLVAGPIERPKNLIPQFYERHQFDYSNFTNGLKRIAWGYFKKLVVADRLAVFVEQVFTTPSQFHGFEVAVGAVFFMFQLYADFSGYSDIAIGTAKVMGFRLMENFDRPHMSRSVTEFWQRWHISLSTWIKDYVFMPLASWLRRGKMRGITLAGFISLVAFGVWHGAGWNFFAFGVIFGLFYSFEILTFRVRKRLWRNIPQTVLNVAGAVFTFSLITLSSIFFRAARVSDAFTLFGNLWHFSADQIRMSMIANDPYNLLFSFIFVAMLVAVQRFQGKYKNVEQFISDKSFILRWSFYILLVYIIFNFGIFNNKEFYYFQF